MNRKRRPLKIFIEISALILGLVGVIASAYADPVDRRPTRVNMRQEEENRAEKTDSEIQAEAQKICKDLNTVDSQSSSCRNVIDDCTTTVYNLIWTKAMDYAECNPRFHHRLDCDSRAYDSILDSAKAKAAQIYQLQIADACQPEPQAPDTTPPGDSTPPPPVVPENPVVQTPVVMTNPGQPLLANDTQTQALPTGNSVAGKINVGPSALGCSVTGVEGTIAGFSTVGGGMGIPMILLALLRKRKK